MDRNDIKTDEERRKFFPDTATDSIPINRQYKDSVFKMLFSDRNNLLKLSSLYNVKEEHPSLELEAV